MWSSDDANLICYIFIWYFQASTYSTSCWGFWYLKPELFNRYRVSGVYDEKVLEICCTTMLIYLTLLTKWSEVAQSCPTLCNPMDCSLPGSSIHRIFQARVLEWVAISFSRGSSWPRDRTWVSRIVGRCFTIWATRGSPVHLKMIEMF